MLQLHFCARFLQEEFQSEQKWCSKANFEEKIVLASNKTSNFHSLIKRDDFSSNPKQENKKTLHFESST